MANPFTIIHLSDAHIGNPKHQVDSVEVLKPLLEDLGRVRRDRGLSPNLIVFSGDLAFGELPQTKLVDQYSQASTWLSEVYNALGCSRDEVPLLLVPGNHDVNRTAVGSDQEQWLDSLEGEPGNEELEDLMKKGAIQWRRMLERQAEWREFVESLGLPWTFDRNLLLSTGVIPFEGKKIGVAGINTSWGCSREQEKGKIWLGKYQAQKAWQELSGCDFKIVVTHHPISWLNDAEANWIEAKIESNFHLHLFGHVHQQWITPVANHLRVKAGPCYAGSTKENAYSWIVVDFAKSSAAVHLRSYGDRGSGGWGPLYIQGRTDEHGVQQVRTLFQDADSLEGQLVEDIPKLSDVESVSSLIRVTQEYFGLRWEPATFQESDEPIVLYWPVRLRPATPIHAVQSYVAAALQKKGAKVILFLDDLGNVSIAPEAFYSNIRRWFEVVEGDFNSLEHRLFSRVITLERARDTWLMVQKWLAGNQYKLDRVLEVSKLTQFGEEVRLEQLLQRRPRRLLTPPLVWACLAYLMEEEGTSIITLGGFDERVLWKAWRETMQDKDSRVGHLYVPVLEEPVSHSGGQAIHMAKRNLAWDSREDIQEALDGDRLAASDSQNWLSEGRMAEWCVRGTILLPAFVKGEAAEWKYGGRRITTPFDLKALNSEPTPLIKEIAREVSRWMRL